MKELDERKRKSNEKGRWTQENGLNHPPCILTYECMQDAALY
jgi:hypothetical protein